jgi:hypothetical protein
MKKTFILMFIVSLTFLACSNKEESARKMLDETLSLEQIGKFDEADKKIQDIIRKYPETKIAVELRLQVLAKAREAERSKAPPAAEQKPPAPDIIPYTPPPWAGDTFTEHPAYTEQKAQEQRRETETRQRQQSNREQEEQQKTDKEELKCHSFHPAGSPYTYQHCYDKDGKLVSKDRI